MIPETLSGFHELRSQVRAAPAKILCVDDQLPNLTALQAALGEPGHELIEARSGPEALRLLLEDEFAVILLDIQMPEMDGIETARLIRDDERTKHIPIIFLTAHYPAQEHAIRGYA